MTVSINIEKDLYDRCEARCSSETPVEDWIGYMLVVLLGLMEGGAK